MINDVVQYLKSTLELADDEVGEYIGEFFVSLDDCCEKLKEEAEKVDFANIRVITHTLMGFCDNMGATDFAQLARSLNLSAKAADIEECKEKIKAILNLHEQYHKN